MTYVRREHGAHARRSRTGVTVTRRRRTGTVHFRVADDSSIRRPVRPARSRSRSRTCAWTATAPGGSPSRGATARQRHGPVHGAANPNPARDRHAHGRQTDVRTQAAARHRAPSRVADDHPAAGASGTITVTASAQRVRGRRQARPGGSPSLPAPPARAAARSSSPSRQSQSGAAHRHAHGR